VGFSQTGLRQLPECRTAFGRHARPIGACRGCVRPLGSDHGCRLANSFLTIVGSAFLFSEFPGAGYLVEPTVVKFIF
jgi:hypothetical protein